MKHHRLSERAFTLIEVTIAIGIVAFSILAILGLLPVGLQSIQQAHEQMATSNVGSAVIADIKATDIPPAAATAQRSPRYQVNVPVVVGTPVVTVVYLDEGGGWSGGGNPPTAVAADSRYRVETTLVAETKRNVTGFVRITWPARASVPQASGVAELPVAVRF